MTARRLPHLRLLPGLDVALPSPEAFDEERAAVDWTRWMVREVFAYEGVFTEPDALVGGAPAARVRALTERVGWLGTDAPDHLGGQLRALAWTCGAEADAVQDGRHDVLVVIREVQWGLIDGHLSRWLPPLVAALEVSGAAPFAAAAGWAYDLVIDHGCALDGAWSPWALPAVPPLLDEPTTGLRRIARVLTTPCFAGGFWSHDAMGAVGRELSLPAGFGSRIDHMENLLRAAAHRGCMTELVAAMSRVIQGWMGCYGADRGHGAGQPDNDPWLRRAADAVATLDAIAQGGAPG